MKGFRGVRRSAHGTFGSQSVEMLEAHHWCSTPGSSGTRCPRGHKSHPPPPDFDHPHSHAKCMGIQGKNTRAAPFPEPNFALKNFPVQTQGDRGSPGSWARPHQAHSPHRTALGVSEGGSALLCPHRPAATPGARAAHGPRASTERPERLTAGCAARFQPSSHPARRRQARL